MSIENIKGYVYMIRNKTTKKIYVGQTLSHSYDEKQKRGLISELMEEF